MITFYIIAIVLVLLSAFFIVYPIIKNKKQTHEQAYILSNTRLIKQRLIELDEEFSQGVISDKHRQQAQKELKLALIDETVPSDGQAVSHHSSQTKFIGYGIFAALLVSVLLMYWQVNHISNVAHLFDSQANMQALTQKIIVDPSQDVTLEDVQAFTLAIRSRIQNNEEDATGWMLLGRLYNSLGQFEQSFQAFDKSLLIKPNDTETLASYAQALMTPNQVEYLRQAKTVLERLLTLEPGNNQAALMLAMTAGQLGDLATSVRYFAQIKPLLPPNNPAIVQIQAKINELKGQPQQKTGFSITINATEEINKRLAQHNRLQPSFLFVFIKDAASNNPLPAAVRKLDLRNLPMTVTLTPDDAMMASYSINDISEVIVTARLSFDENVQASPGELEGATKITKINNAIIPVDVMVNKEIK